MDSGLFQDKIYVVTGGATGIGLAVVAQLLRYGAYVYTFDLGLEASKGLSELPSDRLVYTQCDIRSRESCHNLMTNVLEKHGKLDGLVNNAAVCPPEGELGTDEQYDMIMDTNVRGVWNMGTEALRQFQTQGHGSMVNVGSTSCLVGKNRLALYASSKHAVLGFTRSWALDFAKYGVRVNCVGPGATDTPMARVPLQTVMGPRFGRDKTDDELLAHVAAAIPMGRMGTPDDMANSINFLLSDLASFVTGQILCVGGGS